MKRIYAAKAFGMQCVVVDWQISKVGMPWIVESKWRRRRNMVKPFEIKWHRTVLEAPLPLPPGRERPQQPHPYLLHGRVLVAEPVR